MNQSWPDSDVLLLCDCHQSRHTSSHGQMHSWEKTFNLNACFVSLFYTSLLVSRKWLITACWSKRMMHRIPHFTHMQRAAAGRVHVYPNQYLHPVIDNTYVDCFLFFFFTDTTKYIAFASETLWYTNNHPFAKDFLFVPNALRGKWTAFIWQFSGP